MTTRFNVCGKEIRVQGRFLCVAQLEGDGYDFLEDPSPVIDELAKLQVRIDLFTFRQRLPETEPRYSYPMEWDNFAALPISTFDHWWTKQIGFKARNKAKQAEKKGVEIREVGFGLDLVHGICGIYNECPIRQGRRFPHYGKDVQKVFDEEATFLDRSVFIGAYFEAKLIGFVKLVWDETRTQAGLMNILSLISQRDKSHTNALIARAVKFCADRGIAYLVYSRFAYGRKEYSSIADFKERNGFQRIDVPRYYVPLTEIGRIAFRAGLHHRLGDRLPESVMAKARQFRENWYNKRFQTAKDIA